MLFLQKVHSLVKWFRQNLNDTVMWQPFQVIFVNILFGWSGQNYQVAKIWRDITLIHCLQNSNWTWVVAKAAAKFILSAKLDTAYRKAEHCKCVGRPASIFSINKFLSSLMCNAEVADISVFMKLCLQPPLQNNGNVFNCKAVAAILSSQPFFLMSELTGSIWGWIQSIFGKTAVNWPSLYYLQVGYSGFSWSEDLEFPRREDVSVFKPFGHCLSHSTHYLYLFSSCLYGINWFDHDLSSYFPSSDSIHHRSRESSLLVSSCLEIGWTSIAKEVCKEVAHGYPLTLTVPIKALRSSLDV